MQGASLAIGTGTLGLEGMEPIHGPGIQIGLFHGFPIRVPQMRGGVFAGFPGRRCIGVIDRDHPHLPLRAGHRSGEFKDPLGPDQVEVERGPQGVSAVGGPGDSPSGFSKDGVVEGHHQWPGSIPKGFEFGEDPVEEHLGLNTHLGVEVIMRTPIFELASVGGEQRGNGMTAGANQLSKQVFAQPPGTGRGIADVLFAGDPDPFPLL